MRQMDLIVKTNGYLSILASISLQAYMHVHHIYFLMAVGFVGTTYTLPIFIYNYCICTQVTPTSCVHVYHLMRELYLYIETHACTVRNNHFDYLLYIYMYTVVCISFQNFLVSERGEVHDKWLQVAMLL